MLGGLVLGGKDFILSTRADATSNIVINGVDIGYADGDFFTKNKKSCYSNPHKWENGRCHKNNVCEECGESCNCMRYWPTGVKSTCVVDLKAVQCYGFANYCTWKVYGAFNSNSDVFNKIGTMKNIDEDTLKKTFRYCKPGTHVRIGYDKHSFIITNATDYGVDMCDCNHDGGCGIREHTYSWSELASWIKSQYSGRVEWALLPKNNHNNTEPPTYATLSTDRKGYAVNETVKFTIGSDGDLNTLWVYCPDGNTLTYSTEGLSEEHEFGMKGHYQALVQTWNGNGNFISEKIDFVVGPPTYATLSTDCKSYAVDETVTFTINSDGNLNTLWIYCPNGQTLTYQDVGSSKQLEFGMKGHYQALVQTWNGEGNFISDRIDFVVGPPTYASLSLDSDTHLINEKVAFNLTSDGNTNTLWIYHPDGSKQYYSNAGSSYQLSFDTAGTYSALLETWNGVGSFKSELIEFIISENSSTNVYVSNIEIDDESTPQKVYYAGDTLNPKDLYLNVYYSDGSIDSIENGFTYFPEVLNALGTQEITILYADKSTTFTVNVKSEEDSPYWGDLDNDKRITDSDYHLLINYLKGIETFNDEQLCFADVNIDGSVDVTDATIILKYTKGLIEDFPAKQMALIGIDNYRTTYYQGEELEADSVAITIYNNEDRNISYTFYVSPDTDGYNPEVLGTQLIKCNFRGLSTYVGSITIIETNAMITDMESGIEVEISEINNYGKILLDVEETHDATPISLLDLQPHDQAKIFDIKMFEDGDETQPKGKLIVKIPCPAGYDYSNTSVYHIDTETGLIELIKYDIIDDYIVFETDHFSYYAVVEKNNPTVSSRLKVPASTEIEYAATVTVKATVTDVPKGYYVALYDGNTQLAKGNNTKVSYTFPGEFTSTKNITVKIIDDDENVQKDGSGNDLTGNVEIKAKSGFFAKLIAFFKRLFKALPVVTVEPK